MALAPIVVVAHKRLRHLRASVEALQANTLAAQSDLHVFADGARAGDEAGVREVRKYLRTIGGFRSVRIVERQENIGLDRNTYEAIQSVLNDHDAFILVEDDCVTAPSFLEFVNRGLEVYRDNPRIFSVVGYCPPLRILADYKQGVFVLPRHTSWGSAMWKDRFNLVPRVLPEADVEAVFRSPSQKSILAEGGVDLLNMVKREGRKPHAPAVRMMFRQYQLGMDTVYPVGALTKNIGMDGTGVHSGRSPGHKAVQLDYGPRTRSMPPDIQRDGQIIRAHFLWRLGGRSLYRRPTYIARLIEFSWYRLLHGQSMLPGTG